MDADALAAHAARIDALLATLDGGADVERRASALSSLGVALDAGPPPDPVALIEPVHKALRHSHPSLFVPALASLSALLSALDTPSHLSRAVASWLPPVLERVGDAKERIRAAARGALDAVVAAAMGGMGTATLQRGENAAATMERLLREVGLAGKSPRVREHVTAHLPSLRAAYKLPLRPLLSPLVELLSDADGPVREAARATLLALFGPASGGAKADLKRELEKRGTRKQTAEALLASVFAVESEADETRAAQRAAPAAAAAVAHASAPPGVAPTPVMTAVAAEDVPVVHIATRQDLERTCAPLHACFEGRESEHNWAAREAAIVKLRGMLRAPGGAVSRLAEPMGKEVKALAEGIVKGASTLRTTLAMHSLALIGELAQHLGDELSESVVDLFLSSLLKMAGFTKKLVATASQVAVGSLLQHLSYRHKFLDALAAHLQDKTVATRIWMCAHLCTLLDTHGAVRKHALESHNGLDVLEKALKRALPDQNKDVRSKARDAFLRFQRVWPAEAERMLETLDASTKKQVAAAIVEAGAAAPGGLGSPASAGPAAGVPAKARSASMAAAPSQPPARRPGGPSSAIIAAKRAASERLARERREAEEAAEAEQQQRAAAIDEDAQAAAAAADQAAAEEEAYARIAAMRAATAAASPSTPRERPRSLLDPSSPTGIPAPTTPRGHARSASSSSSQHQATPRLGSDPSPSTSTPSAAAAASRSRAPSASSSTPSHGSAARIRGSVTPSGVPLPASAARARTGSTASSSASSVSRPPRPAQRRPVAMQDPDETTELPAALDDDVSLDLMAFSSSPVRRAGPSSAAAAPERRASASAEQVRRQAQAAAEEARQMQHLLDEPASPAARGSTLPPLAAPAAATEDGAGVAPAAAVPGTPGAKPLAPGGAGGAANWFMKRAARLENGSRRGEEDEASSSPIKARPDAAAWVSALANGQADLRVFRRLAKLSADFPVPLASSSTATGAEDEELLTPGLQRGASRQQAREAREALRAEEEQDKERAIGAWQEGQLFDRLWSALLKQIETEGRSEELQSAALVVLQRLVSHQHALLAATNREGELLSLLLRLRRRRGERATHAACEALIDAWTARTEPILGLGTLMGALEAALKRRRDEAPNGNGSAAAEEAASVRVYTLGLRSLGRLLLRLPAELVEEELPRAKTLVKRAFEAANVDLRLAATQVIVAAHARMQDVNVLFRILEPLAEAQRDLLTYYISKST